jgi:rhodanese-related sulfurtransferase
LITSGRIYGSNQSHSDEVSSGWIVGSFAFVDSRNPQAWAESDRKLPNAIRVPANELDQHLDEIPKDRAVITYCT